MLSNVSVDLGTVALLAAVVWLDGWRRLPTDTLLATRTAFGPWEVRAPWARIGPFALVASWAPLIVPVVVPIELSPDGTGSRWKCDFAVTVARTRRRLRRVRAVVAMLRALGMLEVLLIIVGIPVATAAFGAPGLLYGILGAFVLAMQVTFGSTIALRSLGVPLGRAFRTSAQLLSPFTAPRATEIVTTAAVGTLHSLAPLAALLGDAHFLRWVRPWAYDELASRRHGNEPGSPPIAPLVAAVPRAVLARAVERGAPEAGDDGARYCPRCTRTYVGRVTTCAHCDELELADS
jgi:hypothetical protein